MSGKGRNQRYIFKVSSSHLRRCAWQLTMTIREGQNTNQVVALGDSQILRWIDELNGIKDCEQKINIIHSQIKDYTRQFWTDENIRPVLKSIYQQLDHYQFKKDYCCVVIDSKADYKKLYKDGFVINGIRYRRLLGTSGGIKLNTIVFINEQLLPEIKRRIANGRNLTKEFVPAKLEAYQALVCSSSIPVSMPKGVICVPDCYTHFKSDVIELDDSEDGEPKMTYIQNKEIELCENDGYGLGMPELLERWGKDIGEDYILPGCVIRNSFCKGTIYPIDFRKFAHEHGLQRITDSWGYVHDIEDVELILTESMLKLWDSYSSIDDYLNNCKKNHYTFAITKASEENLENVRNMNYQFLQSYDFSDEDIDNLIEPTVTEIKDVLQNDWRKTLCYVKGFNLNEQNIENNLFGDFSSALMIEPKLFNDSYVQSQLQGMIHKRIQDAKIGVLKVDGCYTLVSGDPYSLCQSMFGLEVTGLLKPGEVYSKYWIDKGINEVVLYRAPMLDMNNVRKVKIVHNKKIDEFYKYMTTPVILNSWDCTADAMSGSDKDGDSFIISSNKTLIDNTVNLPPIQCLQRKASKVIPSEDDIFNSNILSFGNAVGSVTNKATAMFEVRERFPKDSEEYKILSYRIKCIQQAQQNEIDKTKGIVAKPMPSHWCNFFATKPDENDSDEVREWKEFNRRIVCDKKPYFFQYVYPTERQKWMTYQKENEIKCLMLFGIELKDLLNTQVYGERENEFIENYYKRLPLGIAPCTINRICWKIEDEFKTENINQRDFEPFDYSVLKAKGVEYSHNAYKRVNKIYEEYVHDRKQVDKLIHSEKVTDGDIISLKNNLFFKFKRDVTLACPNELELCNILVDICYQKSNANKRFVWEMCGDVIVQNLLERNNNTLYYPIQDENGDFEFGGIKFSIKRHQITSEKNNLENI